jgi:hypothetical protein
VQVNRFTRFIDAVKDEEISDFLKSFWDTVPLFEQSDDFAELRSMEGSITDLNSAAIAERMEGLNQAKKDYYMRHLPTKVQTDDVLNSIFGHFKTRFVRITERSDEVLKLLYRQYEIGEQEFYRA